MSRRKIQNLVARRKKQQERRGMSNARWQEYCQRRALKRQKAAKIKETEEPEETESPTST